MAEGGEKRSPTAHRTPGQIKRHGRTYQAQPGQRKNRAKRNSARAKLMKQGKVRKGDGKHVDHKKPMSRGGRNSSKNLRVLSQRANLRKGNKSAQRKR